MQLVDPDGTDFNIRLKFPVPGADTYSMNPSLTLHPVTLANRLHGLTGLDRHRAISDMVSELSRAICRTEETQHVINGLASIRYLESRRMA